MTGTQVSPHGQLICDLLRTLARVSSSIRAKRKRSLLDEWVSHLSHWELSDSCYEMSQGESWVAVKDILIFHSVTSTSQRGTPVQLQLNTQGKLVQANETTASNSTFVLELNPDTYKLKYFEKELMSSLWVTLKLNKCRGGDVSIDKSTDLVALMKALSDGNCFTREPIQYKGQMIVPWLQELPRFTAGQYVVALIEKELWIRWIRLRADGTKAATCSTSKVSHLPISAIAESSETKPVILPRVEPNYSNVNIVQTALESFEANDNDYHKSQNLSSCESQHGVNNKVYDTARKGMAHELVQSFLEIVRSKDHEKLVFIIGTTQKRCINGHNSTQTMKFYKKSLEAAKLWTIIYLLDSQPARFHSKTTSLSFNTKTSQVSAGLSSSAVSSSGHIKTNINSNGSRYDLINGSNLSPVLKEIARSVVSIPFLESLTPFHELKAIFCTRFLTLGANCFAKQLIEDEDEKDVSEVTAKKSKKKKAKKKKNVTQESHSRLGIKGTGESSLTSSPEHSPLCVVTSPNSLLNISISPHLLTPHLLERSEACIFIGRWVDELVDTATSLSHKFSPSLTILTPFDIAFNSNNGITPVGVGILESESQPAVNIPALNCQLQGERETETERGERGRGCEPEIETEIEILLEEEEEEEEEPYFPCPPTDVECIREEDRDIDRERDRDRDGLVAANNQSLGYTDTDAIVKSTILTSSSRDSWSDMALFPRLDDYDSEKNIPENENENERQKIDLNVNPHSPSLTVEIAEEIRSEEEEEGSRGSPSYLRAPSDVFGGWAFDNISGGPHLGPYYSEGGGGGQGQGGGGEYPPFSDGSSSGSHHDINMNQCTDSIAFQPFNRFLIFHSNANVTYNPQNSNCNTFAYGTLPPRPYDLQTSNAYRNNNWNNSWNNNWNNIGNDDCYTYKCIYSLDDFADQKHNLMDNKEPGKDCSSSSSKINSESNSEDDSNGSKSANDGSNSNSSNNNNNSMRSSQPAGWNNGQSHVVASTTTCSGDSDSSIAYLADSYSTSNHRSSLRRVGVGVLQGTPQDDIRLAAHCNGCADTPPHFDEVPEYHEYRDQTVCRKSFRCEARYREEHDRKQRQDQGQEASDSGNTVSLAASLSPSVGSFPLVPHGLLTGAHDSVSKYSIPVHASVLNTSAQTLCRSHSAAAENEGGDNKNSTKTLEVVTGDIADDGERRNEWQGHAYEGSTPPVNEILTASQSEKMLPTKSMLLTEKETANSWADDGEFKVDKAASSGYLNILKGAELGWKVNLLPRNMLVRRSSAPKLSSTTPPSSSQRQGNMKGREIYGTQHGKDIKKKHQQQQQHQTPHTDDGTASHLASTIPGTCVRKPFSSPDHVKVHRPDVLNLHDRGKSAEIHSSPAIVSGHSRTEQNALSPTVSLHYKPDEAGPTVQEACVPCTNDMPPSGQEDNAYLVTNEFIPRDDGKFINISADRKQGNQEKGEKAATMTGLGCSTTSADTSDPLLALALPRSPPNTVLYTHSSPQTMRVSTSSNKSHSPVVSSPGPPGTLGPLPHTPHSQPMSPSTPLPLSDGNKILTSSPRYAKGESPHSPSCSSRSVIQSPNNDCQGDGRYMKDLLLMSLRCLRSEKERALLLNQQAVQSAVIAGLQHRIFPLPIPLPLPLPTQNLSSRAHLPFAKSLNNEFPPKHSGYTAQNISDEPPHVFNLKRHHTFDSRTERADSDGESGPMMQLNRGFHAMRGGSAYGRGHMGVNPSFPLGYMRGDANAAWEVMSDEGRGTGQFWQASRSRDCDDVYTHHHPAAIGLPYPPRPGSGSGLRPKPFIAKGILGPVLTTDAVPDIEKVGFEVQAAVVELHHEGLREGQGQEEGRETATSAAADVVLAGVGASHFPVLQAPAVKEPRPNIPHGRYATSMQHGLSNKKASHTYTNTAPPVMSAPKSLVEVAQSLGLSADSVQSALSAEILKFVSTVDAQEANLRRVKSDAVDRMRAVVQGLWPRAQVKAFGSFVSGLSLPGSDLDMVICLPNVHTEAAPEAPGGLEGRNSIKESWQQSLARCLSKEEWVAAQSIKVIGNTAIPVVKLKTQILTPPFFSNQAGNSFYENESRHDHGSDRKKSHVRTSASACTGISSRSHDASASVGPGALSSGVCSSGSGSGIDADSGGGSVLSLDISFEGPGHYGLEANKLTTSLIKAYAPLRPLVLVLKYFLTRKGLCEAFTGGLSSYALLLVTARFLQEVELQEPFDLGALLLGVLNFFGDHFDPRVTGISVARRCYFSRAVQTGPQLYPHLARAPLLPPPSAPPHVHLSVSVPTSHTVSGSGTHSDGGLKSESSVPCTSRDNNSDRARGRGQLPSSDHYSFLNAMTHSQQLVIIPKAADRRHSFQANEHASSNPGRDRGRKYLPSTTAGLQPTLSMPSSYSHPNTAHASSGYSSYVPYKFDPLFVEDPLSPGNNVGRNCFRILQVQRSWSEVHSLMSQQIRISARDGFYHSALEILVGKVNISSPIASQGYS